MSAYIIKDRVTQENIFPAQGLVSLGHFVGSVKFRRFTMVLVYQRKMCGDVQKASCRDAQSGGITMRRLARPYKSEIWIAITLADHTCKYVCAFINKLQNPTSSGDRAMICQACRDQRLVSFEPGREAIQHKGK
jgi:hypothetical protein